MCPENQISRPCDDGARLPLVSVCVITFNHANYIAQCLDSILAQQTNFPYEICIGEDESSDKTRELCLRYAEQNPDRIRLFLRSRKDVIYINKRPTGRFNYFKTLEACRGDYIAICDGDDYWLDNRKLQKQVDALQQQPDCALCFSNVRVEYEDEIPAHDGYMDDPPALRPDGIQIMRTPPPRTDVVDLARGNFIHTPSALFRNWFKNEPLPEFMSHVSFGDWPLHLCTAKHGGLVFLKETLAAYRVHRRGYWSCNDFVQRHKRTAETARWMADSGYFPEPAARELRNTECSLQKIIILHRFRHFRRMRKGLQSLFTPFKKHA